jgi:putative nucleotidyltransferase with HDIG domain
MTEAIDQLIERTFRSTKATEETKQFALSLLKELWPKFRILPTSKTGKYHPNICNVYPYGLVNHTIRVIHFIEQQCDSLNIPVNTREKILFAALFHDIGKTEPFSNKQEFAKHAKWAHDWLKERKVDNEICIMARDHMAHWDNLDNWNNAKNITKDWCEYTPILAYSDFLSSRKFYILKNEKFFIYRNGGTELVTELRYIFDSYESGNLKI